MSTEAISRALQHLARAIRFAVKASAETVARLRAAIDRGVAMVAA